jgi:hypothetical protein
MQSAANPSLPRIPVNREKYRENAAVLILQAFKTSIPSAFSGLLSVRSLSHNRERTGKEQEQNRD